MGIQLTPEEMTAYLSNAHTLVLSTIRKSGEPFMTPVWYVYKEGAFFVSTLDDSPKVKHLRRDPRACVLVEDGENWVDLRAVIANCDAEILTKGPALEGIDGAFEKKYAAFRTAPKAMPDSAKKHYARPTVYLKLVPRAGEIRSWYNRKLKAKA